MKRIISGLLFVIPVFFLFGNNDVQAQEATLTIDPATQTVAVNSTYQVIVRVNTGNQAINTVSANITYDSSVVTPQSVDVTGSFITIWFENSINTSGEVIRLSGSIPSPGVNGDNLLFATISFVANSAATTQVQFDADSAIFRDSDNTNILSQTIGGIVTVSTALTPQASIVPTSLTTAPTTGATTITPTRLPDAGTTLPTNILVIIAIILAVGAMVLLL